MRTSSGEVLIAGAPPFPTRVVKEDEARVLFSADRFRSIAEHVEEVLRRGQIEGDRSDLAELLRGLLGKGLLISREDLSNRILSQPSSERADAGLAEAPRIEWHVWPTKDRPEMLRRSVESWLGSQFDQGFPRQVLVCDDSTDETAERNHEMLSATKVGSFRLYFVSRRRRHSLVDTLAKRGLSRELLSFALLEDHGFAAPMNLNRNAALIVTAGSAFSSTDDDTLYRFAEPPSSAPGIRFFSDIMPEGMSLFRSRDRLLDMAQSKDVDPWREHERYLGASPAELLRHSRGDFEEVLSRDLSRLLSPDSHVLLSSFGSVGNTGLPASRIALRLRGRVDIPLSRAEDYLAAVTSNDALRVANATTIAFVPSFMAMSFAADNRRLLPPFFPVGRAMDSVWGATAAVCDPAALFAHLPWAVAHDPPGSRTASREAVQSYQPGFSEYLRTLVLTANLTPAIKTPGDRMIRLGRYLSELGGLDWAEFQESFWERWIAVTAPRIEQLQRDLLQFDYRPRPWAEDVLLYLESLTKWCDAGQLSLPLDFPHHDDVKGPELLLNLVRQYGRLLQIWPDLIAESLRLGIGGSNAFALEPLGGIGRERE